MKTTEDTNSQTVDSKQNSIKVVNQKVAPIATLPSRSVRPQRSMMRVQSLRPKRLVIGTKSKK